MYINKFFLSLIITLLLQLSVYAQLTLRLVVLPDGTPEESTFYVTGDMNGWLAGEETYSLTEDQNGVPSINLDIAAGDYAYKFTRGDWDSVEGNAQGGFMPNRTIQYDGSSMTVDIIIQSWEDVATGNSTAAPNVSVLSDNFFMPQLNRNRKIWIYLPPNYQSTTQNYPVLYMHDAQNLFDLYNSFTGEWEVDESLNTLFENGDEGAIIIGIENGGSERTNEYTPWANPEYGGGDGDQYIQFIVETLKPFIDENYRTKTEAQYTGIMGSSLGGLISLYGAIKYQNVFGRAGVFSPSLWFTDDIYAYVSATGKQADMRIYLLAGEQESSSIDVVADVQAMYNTLLDAGFSAAEILVATHADGEHSEWYWAREFPWAYQWLFQPITFLAHSATMDAVNIWPIPSNDRIYFDGLPVRNTPWQVQLIDCAGKVISNQILAGNSLSIQAHPAGTYFLFLSDNNGQWLTTTIQKQ